MLKDSKFEISDKGKELFEEYEIENEDIGIQFSNEKVCSTNGVAYESECHMRIAACNQQQHLDVANMGECGKCVIRRGFGFIQDLLCLPIYIKTLR